MASGVRQRWAWIVAFALAFLIGFSRLYLGVHFVHDVLAGWLIGVCFYGQSSGCGILTASGSLFGLAAGAAWIASWGGCQACGPIEKRALRYVIGLIGILILWFGLGQVFARDESLIAYSLRYLRYSLVGFWIIAGAPWLFFHFKLAERPNR